MLVYCKVIRMAGTGVYADIIEGDVFKYYSDGEWKKSSSGKSVSIVNPTTRKTQFKVQGICLQLSPLQTCICLIINNTFVHLHVLRFVHA